MTKRRATGAMALSHAVLVVRGAVDDLDNGLDCARICFDYVCHKRRALEMGVCV